MSVFFIDTSNDEIVGDVATNEAKAFRMPHSVVDMNVQTEDGAVAQVLGSPADDPCWNGPCWGDTDVSADDMYSDNSDSIVFETDDKALWTASELQTTSMASQDIRHNRGGELYVSNWDTRCGDEWYLDLERTLSPTWDVSAQVIEILNAAFVFSVGLLLGTLLGGCMNVRSMRFISAAEAKARMGQQVIDDEAPVLVLVTAPA